MNARPCVCHGTYHHGRNRMHQSSVLHRRIRDPLNTPLLLILLLAAGVNLPATAIAQADSGVTIIQIDAAQRETVAGKRLADLQDQFRNALAEDRRRGIELAKAVVAQAVAVFGHDHESVAIARSNLATLQAEARDYDTAIENYRAAVEIFDRVAAETTAPAIVAPLRGLADAYMARNAAATAIPLYERAILVTQINEGPENLEQVPIGMSLSRAWLELDKPRRATAVQESIYRLRQRAFGEASDGYVDALLDRGLWYEEQRDYDTASKTYRRAIVTLRKHHGEDDPRLVDVLLAFADTAPRRGRAPILDVAPGGLLSMGIPTFINRGAVGAPRVGTSRVVVRNRVSKRSAFIVAEARRATMEAVAVARANADEDPALLPRTLVAQGDWMMRRREGNAAWRAYRDAWALLDADEALHGLRDELFAEPTLLAGRRFDRTYASDLLTAFPSEAYTERGSVRLRYGVNASGKPVNVQIEASQPAGLMDGQVVRGLPSFIYRPAYREGRPVLTKDVTYEHQFRYRSDWFTDREREYIDRIEAERTLANAQLEGAGAG